MKVLARWSDASIQEGLAVVKPTDLILNEPSLALLCETLPLPLQSTHNHDIVGRLHV
jgi:hypothetical protein